MISDDEIKCIMMVFATGGDSDEISDVYNILEEKIQELDLPLELVSNGTGPIIIYSKAGALNGLKLVFRMEEVLRGLRNQMRISKSIKISMKVFDIGDVATIDLK